MPSALGAVVTVVRPPIDLPVTASFVERTIGPEEIRAALRFSLAALSETAVGSITLYAGEPGAFAELAGDLSGLLASEPGLLEQDPVLPARAVEPGIDGLEDFSRVNRALGVLLHRGHDLATARARLQRHADALGTDLLGAASVILGTR